MVQRALPGRFLTTDRVGLGFAAVVIVLAAASTDDPASQATERGLDGWAVVLLATAGVLLLGSGRFPGGVALAVLGVSFVWYGVGYTSGLVNVATLIAFYSLGVSEGQARKYAVAGIAVAALLVGMIVFGDESVGSALTAAGYVVMAVLFGEFIRNRQLLVDYLSKRAERAEAHAERRIVEERLQIARDIHDVLAHTVSSMTVQAEVAADALDRDPGAARAALGSIRHAGREAMGDVRAKPAPRIDGVGELANAAREQGVDVEVDIALSGRPLPEMVELTTFRVVQEGITNVVRHARVTSARVTVREEGSSLLVEVRDDGHADGGPAAAGFGLRGMAERVESIGGKLWHGRAAEGGWVVRASLPLPAAPR
jgi:signal transduction histidine kinase